MKKNFATKAGSSISSSSCPMVFFRRLLTRVSPLCEYTNVDEMRSDQASAVMNFDEREIALLLRESRDPFSKRGCVQVTCCAPDEALSVSEKLRLRFDQPLQEFCVHATD